MIARTQTGTSKDYALLKGRKSGHFENGSQRARLPDSAGVLRQLGALSSGGASWSSSERRLSAKDVFAEPFFLAFFFAAGLDSFWVFLAACAQATPEWPRPAWQPSCSSSRRVWPDALLSSSSRLSSWRPSSPPSWFPVSRTVRARESKRPRVRPREADWERERPSDASAVERASRLRALPRERPERPSPELFSGVHGSWTASLPPRSRLARLLVPHVRLRSWRPSRGLARASLALTSPRLACPPRNALSSEPGTSFAPARPEPRPRSRPRPIHVRVALPSPSASRFDDRLSCRGLVSPARFRSRIPRDRGAFRRSRRPRLTRVTSWGKLRWIVFQRRSSSGTTNVMAAPSRPARPVRPMRWV